MLTDRKIVLLDHKTKDYKVADSRGLYILVHHNGSKYWRYNYRLNNKQKTYAIGSYPKIGLKEARLLHDEARLLVNRGIDPVENRTQKTKTSAGKYSFQSLATAWMDNNRGWSDNYRNDVKLRLTNHILPVIGSTHIKEVSRDDLIHIIEQLKRSQLHSGTIKKIFCHTSNVIGVFQDNCRLKS